MQPAQRVAILMPVYNEGERLRTTLLRLRELAATVGGVHVFLVDDGSRVPISLDALPRSTASFDLSLLRHIVNLGQGAALETARLAALMFAAEFDAYVTMDSDGQHLPEDLPQFLAALKSGADVVFGNRFAGESNTPTGRKLLLRMARLFERVVTGLSLSDAHNGYRAFNRTALEHVRIKQNRMAHATEIKQRVAHARVLKVAEVPVSIRYSQETLAKGQTSLGAVQILRDLVDGFVFGGTRK